MQGNRDAASNSKEHGSKWRETQEQKEVTTAFTQEARISLRRHTKWTRQAGYTLACCFLAFEEDGQAPVAVLRNFTPCYTAASMQSSHRGRWENFRPTNLSFAVKKRKCLSGWGLKSYTSGTHLSLTQFLSLHVPTTSSSSSCGVRRCLHSVLQCYTRSFNQMTPGLFDILLSSTIPSPAHTTGISSFPCMSTLEDFSPQNGQTWRVTALRRKGANTLRCTYKSKGLTLLLAKWQTNSANALLHIALTLESLLHSLLMAKGTPWYLKRALRGREDLTLQARPCIKGTFCHALQWGPGPARANSDRN